LLEHCVQGQGHPGCRVHASGAPARSTVACARTGQQPGDPPPHPGGCALVPATRPRSTVHACMHACAAVCSSGPLEKRRPMLSPRFREDASCAPFAAGTPARARGRRRSETVGVDVGGGCRTPRDKGIIAELVPGPERG
jgi:hypothetical protein